MKYKVGDKVRVRSLEWYNENKDRYDLSDCISYLCEKIVIIEKVTTNYYLITYGWWVKEEVLEELEDNEQSFKAVDDVDYVKPVVFENIVFPNENYADKVELCLGDDYEIVVEDGRTFVRKKKPKYPTTYEECRKVLGIDEEMIVQGGWYRHGFIRCFYKLLICRDAYWKIAGNELGLGKSWEPDWNYYTKPKYTIHLHCDGHIYWQDVSHTEYRWLSFPTSEIRDAFYKNFKDLIEDCKELL